MRDAATPTSARALCALGAAAVTMARPGRPHGAGVRLHVERLQRATPIQQFAEVAPNRALLGREGLHACVRILVHRDPWTGRRTLVPVDERVLAGWLAT